MKKKKSRGAAYYACHNDLLKKFRGNTKKVLDNIEGTLYNGFRN